MADAARVIETLPTDLSAVPKGALHGVTVVTMVAFVGVFLTI
jgi:hypothetical protein